MKLINKIRIWKMTKKIVKICDNIVVFIVYFFLNWILFIFLYYLLFKVDSNSIGIGHFITMLFSGLFTIITFNRLEVFFNNIDNKINNQLKNKDINIEDKKLLLDFIIENKKYEVFFSNIKYCNMDFQIEIFSNKNIYSNLLNSCNFNDKKSELLYSQIEENLELYPNTIIEEVIYLLKRKNKEKIIDIKNKLYTEYNKNTIQEESIKYILESNISQLQKIYLISKKEIQEIVDNIELIESSFENKELIILDIFNEMSMDKKLECFKNEKFSIYIKKIYELSKHSEYSDSCYIVNMYKFYFKELCSFVKEQELTDYYQILSFVFNKCEENEIDSIKYRTNTLIDLKEKTIENKKINIIQI